MMKSTKIVLSLALISMVGMASANGVFTWKGKSGNQVYSDTPRNLSTQNVSTMNVRSHTVTKIESKPASDTIQGGKIGVEGGGKEKSLADQQADLNAKMAADNHADEIDMVMNISAFKTGDYQAVENEIKRVVAAAAPSLVKVIIETALLTDEEKRKACQLVIAGGAQFVKTSTGFAKSGATVSDVRLLKEEIAGSGLGIKAAGGIRDAATAKAMLEAGATRIGTSVGNLIVAEDI